MALPFPPAGGLPGWRSRRGLLASLALHVVFALVLAVAVTPRGAFQAPSSPPEAIPVEFWTEADALSVEAGLPPPVAAVAKAAPALPEKIDGRLGPSAPTADGLRPPEADLRESPAPDAPGASSQMIRAVTMLSGKALANPHSRQARQVLGSIEPDTRFEQLCGLEAMEQIAVGAKGHRPDRVVAYAMADTRTERNAIRAEGAAFRSDGHWFHLTFLCQGSRDRASVTAFSYAVGPPIPRHDWSEHGLAPVH